MDCFRKVARPPLVDGGLARSPYLSNSWRRLQALHHHPRFTNSLFRCACRCCAGEFGAIWAPPQTVSEYRPRISADTAAQGAPRSRMPCLRSNSGVSDSAPLPIAGSVSFARPGILPEVAWIVRSANSPSKDKIAMKPTYSRSPSDVTGDSSTTVSTRISSELGCRDATNALPIPHRVGPPYSASSAFHSPSLSSVRDEKTTIKLDSLRQIAPACRPWRSPCVAAQAAFPLPSPRDGPNGMVVSAQHLATKSCSMC